MAARKKTRRKPARRAGAAQARAKSAKKSERHSRPAKKKTAHRTAKKPAKKAPPARKAQPIVKRAAAKKPPAAVALPPTPAPAAAQPRGFAHSLALLASEPVRVAVVTHWFARKGVAALTLEAALRTGEALHVRGATSDFLASAASLRVNGAIVAHAAPGAATLALTQRARPGDVVFALRPPA